MQRRGSADPGGHRLPRPCVLTRRVQADIVAALADGHFLDSACRTAGTTKQTFYRWRNLYASGAEHAQTYADFFDACSHAMATAEARAVGVVRSGAPGWRGAAWYLGRRFPERWWRRRRM